MSFSEATFCAFFLSRNGFGHFSRQFCCPKVFFWCPETFFLSKCKIWGIGKRFSRYFLKCEFPSSLLLHFLIFVFLLETLLDIFFSFPPKPNKKFPPKCFWTGQKCSNSNKRGIVSTNVFEWFSVLRQKHKNFDVLKRFFLILVRSELVFDAENKNLCVFFETHKPIVESKIVNTAKKFPKLEFVCTVELIFHFLVCL